MCLAALYWARCQRIFYGNREQDAAAAGFDDGFLYKEVARPASERSIPIAPLLSEEAMSSFDAWRESSQGIPY